MLDVAAVAVAPLDELANQAERFDRGRRGVGADHLQQQALPKAVRADR